MIDQEQDTSDAIDLLKELISIPSVSRNESETATLLENFLQAKEINCSRMDNNVIAKNLLFDESLPTILLNSHHDTVKANSGYTMNPYEPIIRDGKLYGLGSNDAGGALVSLLTVFIRLYRKKLPYNLIMVASAEEEISGPKGIASVLPSLGKLTLAVVGEPTQMQLATAEKGLMVLDCSVTGKAGHAARRNGENAIEKSINDLRWLTDYEFGEESEMLGKVHLSVTQINAGTQHNVIPEKCDYVVDVRTTDAYTNEEVLSIIRENVKAVVKPRSTRLQPSGIADDHPIVEVAKLLDIKTFGSPTLSDQALIPVDSVKIGPGKSERSHMADEYIYLSEITDGIEIYHKLLNTLNLSGI
ncbi:MAG: M20 family metallo-hydrolase [Cyclobacteriaceae bacterium]